MADNVVIIGGTGFIGRQLTAQLRELGCNITLVSRSAGLGRSDEPGLRYFAAEVADKERITKAIEGANVVYHLAMGGGALWSDYERDFIGGALNIAAACKLYNVRRLIFTSSISALYLGEHRKLYEKEGPDPEPLNRGFYARGKIETERALLRLHESEKLPVVILRPGVVLGRGGMLAHGALGESVSDTCILGWGNGRNPLPCVLVQDVARALVLAKDAPGVEGKAFNLSGDIRPTAREYVSLLRQHTRRNFRFYPRSVWKMQASGLALWSIKALAGKGDNSRNSFRDLKSLTMAADLDCSEAKKMLGWNPVSDREEFFREAIGSHLKPFHSEDLRPASLSV